MKKIMSVVFVFTFCVLSMMPAFAKNGSVLQGTINVNTATVDQLMLLPGVGEVKAQMILDARAKKPFAGKEDLLAVKGIGEKMLEKWDAYITYNGETTLKEVPAPDAGATSPKAVDSKTH